MEEGDGPKRRNSPVHAEQAGMCEERCARCSSPLASMHSRHRRAATEPWKRLQGYVGGTNAALPDATQPIAAMHAGPPGPTFAGQTANRVERLPIDTGKEPFARTGGTSEPSHRRVVHLLSCWVCCRPCLLLSLSLCLPLFISALSLLPIDRTSSLHPISPASRLF